MKKIIKYCILTVILIFLFYFIIGFSLLLINDYLDTIEINIFVYNFTNDDIDIRINNKKLKKINGKTFVIDSIFLDNKIFNFKININNKNLFNKEFNKDDITRSISPREGGVDTQIEVYKLDIENYEIKILAPVEDIKKGDGVYESPKNYLELKYEYRNNIKDVLILKF